MQITKFLDQIEKTLEDYEKEISNANEKKDQMYLQFLRTLFTGMHTIILKINYCLTFKEKFTTKKTLYQKIENIEKRIKEMIEKTDKEGYLSLLEENNQEVKQENDQMH